MKMQLIFGTLLFAFVFLFLASCGNDASEETTVLPTNESYDAETGCSLESLPICGDDGLTYQNSCFSSLRNVAVEHLGACEYTACSFNGQEHYMMNNMIYYEDDQGRPYISVLYGDFRLQADGDGWAYVRSINKESSYYSNRMLEYDATITESGNAITCQTTTEMPDQLKEFLKTHGKILELKIKSYTEQENNTTENTTNST